MKVLSEQHTIILSRRNLESLLAKLDGHPPNSACTIGNDGWWIKAEENEVHYAERELAAGIMHPETEKTLRNLNR